MYGSPSITLYGLVLPFTPSPLSIVPLFGLQHPSLTHLYHSLAHSRTHPLTCSLPHPLTHSLTHSLTHTPHLPLTQTYEETIPLEFNTNSAEMDAALESLGVIDKVTVTRNGDAIIG